MMPLQRITRDRHLSPEEAVEYRKLREQIHEEMPELIAHHNKRQEARDPAESFKGTREKQDDSQ